MRTSRLVRTSLIAALVVLGAGACDPFDDALRVRALPAADPAHPWVVCQVVETDHSILETIVGGESALLTLPRGHSLQIPADALPQGSQVDIRFRQLATLEVAVELTPRGLEFEAPLTLTLSYAERGCEVADPTTLALYRVRDAPPHELLPPPGEPSGEQTVDGVLDRFSLFAIAQ